MSKEPFEKVRSLVERKRLFGELMAKNLEVICKGSDDSLFAFFPQKMLSESLVVGEIKEIEKEPTAGDLEIVGNFSVDDERYFLKGSLKVTAFEGILHVNCDIYKLQRRQSNRVLIPEEMKLIFTLKSLDGHIFFINGKFHDISIGGARIYFPPAEKKKSPKGPPGPKAGMRFEGVIHAPSGKSIEVDGDIKHVLKTPEGEEHYGLEIKTDKIVVKNRLMSLVMDIQHKIVIGLS